MASSSALSWFYRYSARKNYDLYCGMDFRMFPVDTQARLFAFWKSFIILAQCIRSAKCKSTPTDPL